MLNPTTRQSLRAAFGERLRENESLARYTSARLGGPADFLVMATSADMLAETMRTAWRVQVKTFLLGGGSNILVSDTGVRGLVVVNRARAVEFRERAGQPLVYVESGANLGRVARQCVQLGWGGLEWAVTVPGTLGGAVYGNAGAHGGEIAGNLLMAEILQPDGTERAFRQDELEFGYRTSALKKHSTGPLNGRAPRPVVLAAELALRRGTPEALQAKTDEFVAHRQRTQPPGASAGSMFKNPPGDYAGRLIEAAGLKGYRLGQAEISTVHANFFMNLGEARAADVLALIHLAHATVKEKFGVELELEVELIGEWGGAC